MSFANILLAPLVILLPAAGSAQPGIGSDVDAAGAVTVADAALVSRSLDDPLPAAAGADLSASPPFRLAVDALGGQRAEQVRIEQRVTIRVIPRPSAAQRNLLMSLPESKDYPELEERKIGKCLSVSGIAGVQTSGSSQLLLFMRDQRVVRAELERACRARDFYSGFYLSPHADGRLCVDRDTLLSRSGANCKLSRIRQLVRDDD
jgi:hypothetical protein